MNREIKFRVFDEEEESMWTVDGLEWTVQGMRVSFVRSYPPHYNDAMPHRWEYNNSDKLMQYTGLKDKNGVEIYEGDILQSFVQNRRFIIEFDENGYMMTEVFLKRNNKSRMYLSKVRIDDFKAEVIGNIYENPELLKDEKC